MVPAILAKFCGSFFVRFYEHHATVDEMANLGLSGLDRDEKAELASVLDDVISERYSGDDLVNLWRNSPADVWLTDGEQIRELFKSARQKIG